jgi:hypothetical protein
MSRVKKDSLRVYAAGAVEGNYNPSHRCLVRTAGMITSPERISTPPKCYSRDLGSAHIIATDGQQPWHLGRAFC